MSNKFNSKWSKATQFPAFSEAERERFPHKRSSSKGSLNNYYDDEGWWALAWISVYDLTKERRYLTEATSIFEGMHRAFNTTPVPGTIWWDKDRKYVNAIANELFCSVVAHLSNRIQAKSNYDAEIALTSWNHIYASGMINSAGNVEDGLDVGSNPGNTKMVWSYNRGVIRTALTELARATPQDLFIEIAH